MLDTFLPVYLLEFWDALFLIVIIIDFIQLYRIFYPEMLSSQLICLVITTIITFALFIPYPIVGWLAIFPLFAYSFFYGFQPWTWAKDKPIEGEDYFHHYGGGEGEE